ncbi:hypothetical protein [Candidatus Bealeia paramacronuclearis]|uniref:hypothetical protein n=1 Tax=Candidatus Bealeia paramacronuclearis TaxID=1921001 RepID=UPI0030D53899
MTAHLGENKRNIREEVLQKALQNPDFATILMTPVAKEGIIHHRLNRLAKRSKTQVLSVPARERITTQRTNAKKASDQKTMADCLKADAQK